MFTSSELRRRDEESHVACVLLSALTEMLRRLKKVTNKEVINKAALGKEKQRNTVNSSRVTFHLQNNSESRCRTNTVFSKSTLVGCRLSQQQHRELDGCKSALQSCCWLQPDMHDGLCGRVDAVFRELGFKPDTLCHDHTFWSLFFFPLCNPLQHYKYPPQCDKGTKSVHSVGTLERSEGEAASYFSPVVPPCLVADAPGASGSVSKASESHNETLRKK